MYLVYFRDLLKLIWFRIGDLIQNLKKNFLQAIRKMMALNRRVVGTDIRVLDETAKRVRYRMWVDEYFRNLIRLQNNTDINTIKMNAWNILCVLEMFIDCVLGVMFSVLGSFIVLVIVYIFFDEK